MTQTRVNLLSLLKVQIYVLALGEAHNFGWWKSQFLSTVGLSYLGRLYPRSNFGAAVRSAGRAAKTVHDESIGIGNVFHLFRLPHDLERKLDHLLAESEDELHSEFGPTLNQQDKLLEELRQLSGASPTKSPVGPLRLGMAQDLRGSDGIAQLASSYLAAFRNDVKVYPYFEDGGSAG